MPMKCQTRGELRINRLIWQQEGLFVILSGCYRDRKIQTEPDWRQVKKEAEGPEQWHRG